MRETHWEPRDVRKNLDETALDAIYPQAFPAERAVDILGRIRVRIRAEGRNLVAYGYGSQRIVIPATDIGAVCSASLYRANGWRRTRALLVLDKQDRIMLRAAGLWETYGEVEQVCRAIEAPRPSHVGGGYITVSRHVRGGWQQTGRLVPYPQYGGLPRYRKAAGYRRLRTLPRCFAVRVLAIIALFAVAAGIVGCVGLVPALLLPDWTGKVRVLIGIAGGALGAAAGIWLAAALTHVLIDGLRWAAASVRAAGLAPANRFFRRHKRPREKWSDAATAGLVVLIPLLVAWGPVLAFVSGVHGVADSALVAKLRAGGARTQGTLIDVPHYSTDSSGSLTVNNVPTLAFTGNGLHWQVTDPSIGGRPLALDAGNPFATNMPLTVVYDREDPNTAASLGQIAGSVWHGAPMANVITGIAFTLVLPALTWRVVLRVRRRTWARNADLLDGIAKADA